MLAFFMLALALSSCASGTFVPRDTAPEGWLTAYLELYDTYHERYLALSCKTKHGTEFFDQCCHPLLAKESLSSRPPECDPANLDATDTTSDDDDLPYCDEDDELNGPLQRREVADVVPTTTELPPDKEPTRTDDQPIPTDSTIKQAVSTFKPASGFPHLNFVATRDVNTGGYATYYYQNGVPGACGTVHSDSDFICAIDAERYGSSGARSSLCGKWVQITNVKNGRSVDVYVADDCPTCMNANSIDLSVAAFQAIAPLAEGMVPIQWIFT